MLRVAYFGYRTWAFAILNSLLETINPNQIEFSYIGTIGNNKEKIDHGRYKNLHILDPKNQEFIVSELKGSNIELALFYGWSWMVPVSDAAPIDCLCLHPSLLPKYRGGSPLQYQIMRGEEKGGLTIFRMNEVLDGGDILMQRPLTLEGTLSDIFNRIIKEGTAATLDVFTMYLCHDVRYTPQQNLENYPILRRRTPRESEVLFSQLEMISCNDFYNFVRALDDPYSNCFIRMENGKRFCIKEVEMISNTPREREIFNGTTPTIGNEIYMKLKDGFVRVRRYVMIDSEN